MSEQAAEPKEKTPAASAAASDNVEKSIPVEMERCEDAPVYRYFRAGKSDFSDDNTFQVKMSSEFPGEQRASEVHEKLGIAKKGEKYVEILSHEKGDADLSRFTGDNRAALLDEHIDGRHLGYIKTAAVSDDKCARGVVVFDNITKLSKTRCKQVREDSRPNFSLGYIHTKYLGTRKLTDGRTGHVFGFQALELSNVDVPMDPTARKGRSKNAECHCIRCGDLFGRKELNDDFMCPDCTDAETPAEEDAERKEGEKQFRSVDLNKNTTEQTTHKNNFMAKTLAELKNEAPELVTEIQTSMRTETEKTTRKAVLDEVHQASEKRSGKIGEQLKEIRTLADAHCADSGKNWSGPDGKVVVVADEVRKLERSAYDEISALKDDETFHSNATTIRNKFKTDAGELVRNSYAPREMREAGTLAADLAEKVSLRRLWDQANVAFEKGDRRKCFLLTDGAEAEADKELRTISGRFPGGLGYSPEGQLFPQNARGHIRPELRRTMREVDARRSNGEHLTRDGLLSDYPSLGALVPPEYMTPIELLRNKLVLVGKGLMECHGVVGNPLTFPRLAAPTTAQSLAEGVAATAYDQVFDQVKLTPHRVTTKQLYSRLGMSQAPGFEAIVWDDHARTAALYMNRGLVNGTGGTDDVLGILNYVGIGALPFAGSAANAWANIFGPTGLVTLIRKANVDDDITMLSTSVGAGALRTTVAALKGATAYAAGGASAILQGDKIGGCDFEESQQIPADLLLAAAARHIILATWAGLNIVLDTTQFADQDKFRLVTNQYYDVGLRHNPAVSRSVDSINNLA